MSKEIVIDIETLPCGNPFQIDYLLASVKPDSRLKDPAKIEADIAEKRDEVVGKTGLDGSFGRVLMGTIMDIDSGDIVTIAPPAVDNYDEKEIIVNLLSSLKEMSIGEHTNIRPKIIGHNTSGFDLRFIAQRCAVHGIWIDRSLVPFDAKPWELADTMVLWAGAGKYISLDRLCVALGVKSPKGEMDGSQVAQYFAEGRLQEIIDYNRADVIATAECYRKLKKAGMV